MPSKAPTGMKTIRVKKIHKPVTFSNGMSPSGSMPPMKSMRGQKNVSMSPKPPMRRPKARASLYPLPNLFSPKKNMLFFTVSLILLKEATITMNRMLNNLFYLQVILLFAKKMLSPRYHIFQRKHS